RRELVVRATPGDRGPRLPGSLGRPRAERRAVARGAVHLARRLARIRACRAHERGARDRARDARGGTPSWLTSADRTPSRLRSAGRTPSWLRSARRARLET